VKRLRIERRLSPAALGALAGVDAKTIRTIESGARTPQDITVAKVEEALQWVSLAGPSPAAAAKREEVEAKLAELSAVLQSFTRKIRGDVLSERVVPSLELDDRLGDAAGQIGDHLRDQLELVIDRLKSIEAVLEVLGARLHVVGELLGDLERLHDSSPSVGGCGDPQPTEGEARKGGEAA
jgi:transcriptional regulator with XRE-family HTH domain